MAGVDVARVVGAADVAGVDVARVVGAGSGVGTRGVVTAGLVVRMFAEISYRPWKRSVPPAVAGGCVSALAPTRYRRWY